MNLPFYHLILPFYHFAPQFIEETLTSGVVAQVRPSGAKALHILLALSARLKSRPVTKPVRIGPFQVLFAELGKLPSLPRIHAMP
jgi:hypothetical protein